MTWSGTYTNEDILLSPYQAKNGVRGIVNMDVVGPVDVLTPSTPEEDESFSIWGSNPNRDLLEITAPAIQNPRGVIGTTVSTRVRYFIIGYTFYLGVWRIDKWQPFVTPLGIKEAAEWIPRSTNGPCTIVDSTPGMSVDRTAEGFYTINLDEAIVSADIVMFNPFVVGLAAENSAEVIEITQGPMSININTGFRNKNGQFTDSDLDHDPSNTISIFVQEIP